MEVKNDQKIRTRASIAAGVLTIFCAVFSFLMTAVYAKEAEKYEVMFAAAGAVLLLTAGAALVFCRRAEVPEVLRPIVCVRERKVILILAVFTWLLGAVLVFAALTVTVVPPSDFVMDGVLATGGFLLLLCGVWAFLAVRNRCLVLFSDGTMTYYTSWGRQKNYMQTQISHIQIGANGSVRLKNADGKTLVSVENNMLGMEKLGEWLEARDIDIELSEMLKRQVIQEEKEEGSAETADWKETAHTELHGHIKWIRAVVTGAIIWFLASTFVPVGLYLQQMIKYRHMIYLTASSAIPFFICYLLFAPVISLNGKKGKTQEWKEAHAFASVWLLLLPAVLLMKVYGDLFSELVLRIIDEGRWLLLWIAVGIVSWGLLFWRTPKRLRGEGIFMMILFCLAMGSPMAYGLNLALCRPAIHYPAEIIERDIKQEEGETSADYFLTVRLEDGTETEFEVVETLFFLERAGQEIQVCLMESPLGIRMADLHLPK